MFLIAFIIGKAASVSGAANYSANNFGGGISHLSTVSYQ